MTFGPGLKPRQPSEKRLSYKLACWDKSGGKAAYNGLRFATAEECERYGKELYSRWMGLDRFEVHTSTDPVNSAADQYGKLTIITLRYRERKTGDILTFTDNIPPAKYGPGDLELVDG